jgi:hypothetical protein
VFFEKAGELAPRRERGFIEFKWCGGFWTRFVFACAGQSRSRGFGGSISEGSRDRR